jgi:prepilin-type N-terminal cleavage/methylation domain-containing protein
MKSPRRSSARGFTLIEVVIVVALAAVIIAMGTIMGYDTLGRSSVHEERDLLVTLLTGARARALANVNEQEHGVHVAADSFVLFAVDAGDPYDPGDPANVAIERRGDAVVAGDDTVVFEQLSAAASPATITLTQGAASSTISINAAGRIEW